MTQSALHTPGRAHPASSTVAQAPWLEHLRATLCVSDEGDGAPDSPLSYAQRTAFLAAQRRGCEAPPWQDVHASWIATCLPPHHLLRLWAINSLPPPSRLDLLEFIETESTVCVRTHMPPEWFSEWWSGSVRRQLGLRSGQGFSPLPSGVFRQLCKLSTEEAERALRRFGLRSLATALPGQTKNRIVGLVGSLTGPLRDRLSELARAASALRALDPQRAQSHASTWCEAWSQELTRLLDEEVAAADVPLRLALTDIGAHAAAHGRTEEARRFALTLPYSIGRHMLRRLESGPGSLATSELATWESSLADDLDFLVRSGAVRLADVSLRRGGDR